MVEAQPEPQEMVEEEAPKPQEMVEEEAQEKRRPVVVACERPGHPTNPHCKKGPHGHCWGKVRYGDDWRWTDWKPVNGAFYCSTDRFGEDPCEGTAGECQCLGSYVEEMAMVEAQPEPQEMVEEEAPKPQEMLEEEAQEKRRPVVVACEVPGHPTNPHCKKGPHGHCWGKVRYGADWRWTGWKTVSGAFYCSTSLFGEDPCEGTAGECQCLGEHREALEEMAMVEAQPEPQEMVHAHATTGTV